MILNKRLPIDFHEHNPSAAMASLDDTAMQMLQQLDSGLDFGDSPRERIERLERMVAMLILRESVKDA